VSIFGTLIGAAVIVVVLWDTFETILQPRRVTHRFRFARFFIGESLDPTSVAMSYKR